MHGPGGAGRGGSECIMKIAAKQAMWWTKQPMSRLHICFFYREPMHKKQARHYFKKKRERESKKREEASKQRKAQPHTRGSAYRVNNVARQRAANTCVNAVQTKLLFLLIVVESPKKMTKILYAFTSFTSLIAASARKELAPQWQT